MTTAIGFPDCCGERRGIIVRYAPFLAVLITFYVILFILPRATDALMLDPARFFQGQFWRLLTYQFVHNSLSHLLENSVALLLSIILAVELKSSFPIYSMTYFSAGALAILPIWIVSPFLALGASAAIYGSFGFLSKSAERFRIRPYLLMAAVAMLTVLSAAYRYWQMPNPNQAVLAQQLAAHLSGLVFGYYFCVLVVMVRERRSAAKSNCLRTMT